MRLYLKKFVVTLHCKSKKRIRRNLSIVGQCPNDFCSQSYPYTDVFSYPHSFISASRRL